MSRKLKFLIILASFIGIGWFIQIPLSDIGVKHPYSELDPQGHKLTADELNQFLDLWSRASQSKLKRTLGQISLRGDNSYPRPLVKWLNVQGWSVERFFYDEQRLRELVEYAKIDDNIKSNIQLSQHTGTNLNEIIKEQRQRLKLHDVDEEELHLIQANLYQIIEIFAGRAVLATSN